MGVQPEVQLFIVKSYRITELHYKYGNATLSEHCVGYLYFQNHWVTQYIRVSTLRAAHVGQLYLKNHWVYYTYGCLTLSLSYCC